MDTTPRKGARRIADIPPEVLEGLNAGLLESANLVEWLAIDHAKLWNTVGTSVFSSHILSGGIQALQELKKPTVNTKNAALGAYLSPWLTADEAKAEFIRTHPSDMVRGWYCYSIAYRRDLSLAEKLNRMHPMAADPHFGVRELAWMALRPHLEAHLNEGILLLTTWVEHPNEGVRRFASEITRPCGVWCSHIQALKQNPQTAEALLRPLRADPSRYVQNSVANWLNDASKSQPKWVQHLCATWLEESDSPATRYIVKRGLRSIR